MVELHEAYLSTAVVPPRYADDALHVALAMVARADVLVSWNFRHLVNPARVRAFNGINTAQGYGPIIIMTPSDIVSREELVDYFHRHAETGPFAKLWKKPAKKPRSTTATRRTKT